MIIGLGCQGCSGSDGDWLTNGLVLTFFVAIAGFVGVLVARGRARLLAGVEVAGAVAMIVAIAFVALDGGDMHLDDSRLDASFLYWVFALIAILFVGEPRRRRATQRPERGTPAPCLRSVLSNRSLLRSAVRITSPR